jgi:hypothetical protein
MNLNSKIISNITKFSTLNNSNNDTDMSNREHEDSLDLEMGNTSPNIRATSSDFKLPSAAAPPLRRNN